MRFGRELFMIHNAYSVSEILKKRMPICIPMICDLREGRDAVKRIQKQTGWRYGLTGNRCAAVLRRYRDEALRCVATRRITSRTGAVSGSEDLEKTGSFVMKIKNRWPVFQCTVNWARARLRIALIASGASGSRVIYSVDV
tara:strand:+ start:560 stop:982 length:423 start_codon:yes stop_codon:yes gene_type:complete